MKEYQLSIILTDEEEAQLEELTRIFAEYIGREPETITDIVLHNWITLGLAGHMAENYNYLTGNYASQLQSA